MLDLLIEQDTDLKVELTQGSRRRHVKYSTRHGKRRV